MNSSRRCAILAAAAVLSLALAAQGQQRAPRIGYVYPAGGRQGATFRVTIGGQFLDGASTVLISGEGVGTVVIEHAKPLDGKEFQLLRDKLKDLMEKKLSANGSVVADRVLERLRSAKASSSRTKPPRQTSPPTPPPRRPTRPRGPARQSPPRQHVPRQSPRRRRQSRHGQTRMSECSPRSARSS